MNILYIDHYAGSLGMGMEFRPYYMAREWQKAGHKVLVVGADFSHLRKSNPTVAADFEKQTIEGVDYMWVKAGSYEGNGAARAMSIFHFCGKLFRRAGKLAKEFKPDCVISSSTYPLDTYPAQKIARIAGAKYIHEAHDLWPLTLTEIGGMSKAHPFVLLLQAAENAVCRKADHVVGVLPNSPAHMLKHGLGSVDRFTHIPNGVVTEDWENSEPLDTDTEKLLDGLKADGKFIQMYLGGHALSNALDTLVDAAKDMQDNSDNGVAFVLVGKGVEKPNLIAKAEGYGLKNIYFLEAISKTQVPSMLAKADALYVGGKPVSLYRFGVSMNKVYDYMMAAKPIVYGVEAYNNDVAAAGCGITVEPENPNALGGAVRKLAAMTETERQKMGENGRRWVLENCDYKKLAEKFIEVIEA